MYAVCVTFKIKNGEVTSFMEKMTENAQTSLQEEGGCLQFDVLSDPERPNEAFLYELYSDRQAFDLHLQSAHFKVFDAATLHMIATKQVQTWSQVAQ
jgi:autoinducer 2-degrading protein